MRQPNRRPRSRCASPDCWATARPSARRRGRPHDRAAVLRRAARPGSRRAILPGRLIVIEGTDGVGRSTHVALLKEWLEARGYAVVNTGLRRSQLAGRGIERAKRGNTLDPLTLNLLYATDFWDRMERQILPALRAGMVALVDRYIFSLMARALVRGLSREWIENLFGVRAGARPGGLSGHRRRASDPARAGHAPASTTGSRVRTICPARTCITTSSSTRRGCWRSCAAWRSSTRSRPSMRAARFRSVRRCAR